MMAIGYLLAMPGAGGMNAGLWLPDVHDAFLGRFLRLDSFCISGCREPLPFACPQMLYHGRRAMQLLPNGKCKPEFPACPNSNAKSPKPISLPELRAELGKTSRRRQSLSAGWERRSSGQRE